MGSRERYWRMLLLVFSAAVIHYVGATSASEPGYNLTTETGFSIYSTPHNGSFEDCDINTTFVASSRASGNITPNVSKCLENDPIGPSYSRPVIQAHTAVYATLCLGFWSVVANSLPLAAIMKHERLHTPAYILMANLAASDVLTGVVFIFSGSSILCYSHSGTSPSDAMLRLRFTFVLLSGLSSAYSLLALTAERYWFIVHGMTYVNNVTNDKCKVVVLIVWLWSVLLAMLPNFGWHCASRTEEGCLRFGGGLPLSYVVLILAFVFIPMAAIVVFNLSVFWCLWKHVNAIAAQEAAVGAPPSVSRKSAVTVVIITVVFLVGWMPFAIKMAMFTQDSASLARMFVFVILNSAINPVIYGFRLQEVRRGVARLFRNNHVGNVELDP
ncbi:G-protein coupled receptor 6-like [Branchiostoma floridae x Branchiostoma japonicum]